MKTSPKISIVTPSFNQGRFIERTILSVLDQDYQNLEYIIIDGGSTDDSVGIIKKYESRLAYWISESDCGQSDAINKGFMKATGDIFAWLNADDKYKPGAISKVVQIFSVNPDAAIVYGDGDTIDEYDNYIFVNYRPGKFDFKRLVEGNFIFQPAAFFKKGVIQNAGYLDENLHYAMDYDLWLKAALKFKIYYFPSKLAEFREHAESKTISKTNLFSVEEFNIINNLLFSTRVSIDILRAAYSHILRLLLQWQKEQIILLVKIFQSFSENEKISPEEMQDLKLFFSQPIADKHEITRIQTTLFKLYIPFLNRHSPNEKDNKKIAHYWISRQMLQLAQDMFDDGYALKSKQFFSVILKMNPNILKEVTTFKLLKKYSKI